jgi:hypothetical protein
MAIVRRYADANVRICKDFRKLARNTCYLQNSVCYYCDECNRKTRENIGTLRIFDNRRIMAREDGFPLISQQIVTKYIHVIY